MIEKLAAAVLGYREVMGLTPKSLRRLRGITEPPAASDEITKRLDQIAERVSAYDPPDPAEKETEWAELGRVFDLDTAAEAGDPSTAALRASAQDDSRE